MKNRPAKPKNDGYDQMRIDRAAAKRERKRRVLEKRENSDDASK